MDNLLIKISRASEIEQNHFEHKHTPAKFKECYTIEFMAGQLDGKKITVAPQFCIDGLITFIKKLTLTL